TPNKVGSHSQRKKILKLGRERHQAKLLINLGNEFRAAAKRNASDANKTVVHALVLLDTLAEGAALVVDCEGGDLLDKLQEVDRRIEKRWGEFAFEIHLVTVKRLNRFDVVGYVNERSNVNCKL